MSRRAPVLVPLLVLLACVSVSSVADDELAVEIDVTAQPELEADLVACLTETVEGLDRVTVRDKGPVTLRVILMEQKATDGRSLGYLLYQAGHLGVTAADPEAVVVHWEGLRAVPPDLRRACSNIVADFRHEVLDDLPASSRSRPRIRLLERDDGTR